MTKQRVQQVVVTFIVCLLAASAFGYLFFPAAMLNVVGITGNAQMDFLVRTLAAALVSLIPGAWIARKGENPSLYKGVILGLAIYMFLGSAVDLHAFVTHIVNRASIPSVVFRVLLGGVLLWLISRK
jgi:uncharacterized membrane-anchored protein YitT (DUF2179 family)